MTYWALAVANHARLAPFVVTRRVVETFVSFYRNIRLALLVELQARASTFSIWFLIGFGHIIEAAILNLVWSLAFCQWYEKKEQSGMEDLVEVNTSKDVGGWVAKLFRIWFLGLLDLVLMWVYKKLYRAQDSGRVRKILNTVVLTTALFTFGVLTSHTLLKHAGFTEERVHQLNLAGRLLNMVYKILWGLVVVFAARWFWMLFHTSNEMASSFYHLV